MQEDIQCVNMIISGLLEEESVFPYLLPGLTFQDFPATLPPPRSSSHPRKQSSQRAQGQSFAQEMGIRRKIRGQIGFNVPSAQAQPGLPLLAEFTGKER